MVNLKKNNIKIYIIIFNLFLFNILNKKFKSNSFFKLIKIK